MKPQQDERATMSPVSSESASEVKGSPSKTKTVELKRAKETYKPASADLGTPYVVNGHILMIL